MESNCNIIAYVIQIFINILMLPFFVLVAIGLLSLVQSLFKIINMTDNVVTKTVVTMLVLLLCYNVFNEFFTQSYSYSNKPELFNVDEFIAKNAKN